MEKQPHHSQVYHKYFEGYAEKQVIKDGKIRIERVYVGNYYRASGLNRARILRKILYVLLYFISVFSLVSAGLLDLEINYFKCTAITQAAGFFTLLLFLIPLFFHTIAPITMTIRDFRDSSENLKRLGLAATVALGINFVLMLFSIITGKAPFRASWRCLLANALSCCAIFAVFLLEKRQKYEIIPPSNRRPEKSSIIRYR